MSKNQRALWARAEVSFRSFLSQLTQNGRCLLLCLPRLLFSIFPFPFPIRPPGEVGVAGVEPATLRLSSACSNQLSYTPKVVEAWGFEPQTYSLQSYRSTN